MVRNSLNLEVGQTENEAGERYSTLEIAIDGISLLSRVQKFEAGFPECWANPRLAGAYASMPLQRWHALAAHGETGHKVMLLQCPCGESGCWPLMAEIVISGNQVRWQNFQQPHRAAGGKTQEWNYDGFGPFIFDLSEYQQRIQYIGTPSGV